MTPRRAAGRRHRYATDSSLSRSEATWDLAVWTEMPNRRAITLFDAPSASSARTSSSRASAGHRRRRWRDDGGRDDGCIGGLSRTNQPQTRHAREQGGEPVGQRRVLDDEGRSDRAWCSVLAQAAGPRRWSAKAACLAGSTQPDRDRLADAVRSEGVQDNCTCRIGSLFQLMTMSPW